MRRYESYKDSGVEWLGEVPSHWELKRLKQLFVEKNISKTCLLIVEPLVLVKLLKKRMIK
ncbi:putative type I site-specific restriction-modification system, S subunit [Haemophilus influenzae PittAA]|nr:putative type I site-specific restriction-modification system, S subunit [Haemophilus influenzae PittAA]